MKQRERAERFAQLADNKLAVEGVDTNDHEAVKACLLRCVAGSALWEAWIAREESDDD